MARNKAYIEKDVIEKATELFWRNGYESTSMKLLEEAMGINKFSIYASFGSKKGVFLESIKCYKTKVQQIVSKLKESTEGKDAIKNYFYDSLTFSKNNQIGKGCLLTNTASELGAKRDTEIMSEVSSFLQNLKEIFIEKLSTDKTKDLALIRKQANFLLIAKQGLSNASKVFEQSVLDDYIEMTFEKV